MLAELTLTLGEWYAVAEKALTRWPIEKFTASDVPGLSLTIHPTSENADWELKGSLKVPSRRVRLGAGSVAELLVPYPHLVEPAEEFTTDTGYTGRDVFVATIRRASDWVVQELQ